MVKVPLLNCCVVFPSISNTNKTNNTYTISIVRMLCLFIYLEMRTWLGVATFLAAVGCHTAPRCYYSSYADGDRCYGPRRQAFPCKMRNDTSIYRYIAD